MGAKGTRYYIIAMSFRLQYISDALQGMYKTLFVAR